MTGKKNLFALRGHKKLAGAVALFAVCGLTAGCDDYAHHHPHPHPRPPHEDRHEDHHGHRPPPRDDAHHENRHRDGQNGHRPPPKDGNHHQRPDSGHHRHERRRHASLVGAYYARALNDAVALLRCAPSIIESDVFERAGWQVGQRYTWRFDALRPLPQMMADASQLRRRDFARNAELLTVDYCVSPAELASLHDGQYRRQGKRDVVDAAFMARVAATAVEHGNGVVAGVSDAAGTLQAAVFVAYDSNCAYLLLLARGAEAPRNAMAYLVWRIVEWLTSRTRMFDFEGGAEPGVGEYYRSFGACQVPYLQLTRCRMPLIGKMLGL